MDKDKDNIEQNNSNLYVWPCTWEGGGGVGLRMKAIQWLCRGKDKWPSTAGFVTIWDSHCGVRLGSFGMQHHVVP
jgi:hypothetical protein